MEHADLRGEEKHIVVLIASHNRVDKTLSAMGSLHQAAECARAKVTVVLVDAGSTDGTVTKTLETFPDIHVIHATDDHFWAKAMELGWEETKSISRDYTMWLNDDVTLDEEALVDLLSASQGLQDSAIVLGSTRAVETGHVTYGGHKRGPWFRRLSGSLVQPGREPQPVDFINGNVVLIPWTVDQRLGGFPKGFNHAVADYFFSCVAQGKRVKAFIAPGTQGTCNKNDGVATWRSAELSPKERWDLLLSPKGLPPKDWMRFCFRCTGVAAPIYAVKPYVTLMAQRMIDAARSALRASKQRPKVSGS